MNFLQKYFSFYLGFILYTIPYLFSDELDISIHSKNHQLAFQKNQQIDDYTWVHIQSYLLPDTHPIKYHLDAIFFQARASSNINTLNCFGFKNLDVWRWDKAVVARNSRLKGYIFKFILDDQVHLSDHTLIQRIQGERQIREAISILGYDKYFVVPQKWLYVLPDMPPVMEGCVQKDFFLIAEEIQILNEEENKEFYAKKVSKEQLKALHHLVTMLGLTDSVRIDNIPATANGKIAFIDTERHHFWPVNYKRLGAKLSPKMRKYWEGLTN